MSNDLVLRFGQKYGVHESEVLQTLKATCFQGPVTDAQMTALLVVADQFSLNPFLKEIYAFPDKRGGIVPVVSIDGWLRIVNEHPMFDGVEFHTFGDGREPEAIECTLYRKDRSHPIRISEYFSECVRASEPWKTHPKRMLRHKALIQCARVAFGFGGIYDQDEAERILEKDITPRPMREDPVLIATKTMSVEDDEARQQLRADLEAIADNGSVALKAAWEALTTEQRKLHGGLSNATKQRAKQADEFMGPE